jgi:hypothetical protein
MPVICRVSVHNLLQGSAVTGGDAPSWHRFGLLPKFCDVFRYHLGVSTLICSSVLIKYPKNTTITIDFQYCAPELELNQLIHSKNKITQIALNTLKWSPSSSEGFLGASEVNTPFTWTRVRRELGVFVFFAV